MEAPDVGTEPVLLSVLGIAWCDVLLFFRRRKRGGRKLAGWRTRSVIVLEVVQTSPREHLSVCNVDQDNGVPVPRIFRECVEMARLIPPWAGAAPHHDVRAA